MTTEDAFLQAILANPRDDGPRQMYADWLTERGSPADCDRATLIAWMLRRPRQKMTWRMSRKGDNCAVAWEWTPGGCPDISLYFKGWEDTWRLPFIDWAAYTWRRGFLEGVQCSWADWQRHGPSLVRSQPVRQVRLTDLNPDLSATWMFAAWYDDAVIGGDEGVLPHKLYRLMRRDRQHRQHPCGMRVYRGVAKAGAALSRAAIAWAASEPPTAQIEPLYGPSPLLEWWREYRDRLEDEIIRSKAIPARLFDPVSP